MNRVLVVGADRGIAYAICRQLAGRHDDVIAGCLQSGGDLGERGVRIVPDIDVTSDAAVARLGRSIRNNGEPLQWLLHVAGVLGVDALGAIDFADVRRQFEINTLGPLRVVQALLPSLQAGAKVGIVTSRVGSLADNSSGGMYAYRISKCAANMVARNLHHDLAKRGIAVTALHPGMVATDLTKGFSGDFITPDQAAAGLIQRMDELTLETSGGFVHANGERLPW
jgi:NAD(P)-dependent dehydrogenase (short-subunit alcohol dehydrogenase family)